MKTVISMFMIFTFPAFALAAGQHSGGHHEDDKQSGAAHGSAEMHSDSHASAAGRAGDPGKVSRTIGISMSDAMRFTPSEIKVKQGETIRFFVKNDGKVPHEMVVGTMAELKAHAVQMRSMPDMKHAEPNTITLKPGQRGGIVWLFDKPGTVDFACLIPGHLEAGMAGKVEVE